MLLLLAVPAGLAGAKEGRKRLHCDAPPVPLLQGKVCAFREATGDPRDWLGGPQCNLLQHHELPRSFDLGDAKFGRIPPHRVLFTRLCPAEPDSGFERVLQIGWIEFASGTAQYLEGGWTDRVDSASRQLEWSPDAEWFAWTYWPHGEVAPSRGISQETSVILRADDLKLAVTLPRGARVRKFVGPKVAEITVIRSTQPEPDPVRSYAELVAPESLGALTPDNWQIGAIVDFTEPKEPELVEAFPACSSAANTGDTICVRGAQGVP